jgi:nucleotide-binding universal stress UspA family protein
MKVNSILCPIDFSDFSTAAYQYALSLADYYKASLVALHVVEHWKYPFADYAACEVDYQKFSKALNEGGEVRLRRFAKENSATGVEPRLVVHQGNAPSCILSFAEKQQMEVIVMGTHGRRGFDRVVLGSTTDRVMRQATCPVLVVSSASHKDANTSPDRRHRLSRILYCTDFSNDSKRALAYATSLTAEYGAELTLLHVAEKASDLATAEAIIARHSQELDRLISDTERKSLNVRSMIRLGKPYEEIVRHATEMRASLIIMSARGGDAVDRAVFGSTTYRVIQFGPSPVLAIHT